MCTINGFFLIGGVYFVSLSACRFDSELETFVDFFWYLFWGYMQKWDDWGQSFIKVRLFWLSIGL